jgi:hypothetical protein
MTIHGMSAMYDDKNIQSQDQPDEEENPSVEESQDEFFGEEDAGERLDETETDESADEGIGNGKISRGRDDLFQK